MSFPEFGEVIEQAPENASFPEFGEEIEPFSRFRSIISAPVKGAIKGAASQSKISPFHNVGPISQEQGEELLERFLPTYEKPLEGFLERGGKIGASFLTGGTGGLIRKGVTSAIGALAGETTKQLGGGELAQEIAELSSMTAPDLAKSIPAQKVQKKVIDFLRNKGFTENEITPLLQSPKKLARFAKFSSKGEKTNKLMRDTYEKFDNVYSSIRNEAEKLPGLPYEKAFKFVEDFEDKLAKIPKFYKRQIKEEIEDLLSSEMKFTDFMDFEQAVNARIKGVQGGKAILGTLKKYTSKAKEDISPELAGDLSLANELYGKRIEVSNHLKTKQIDDLIDLGEAATLIGGIADQNVGLLTKALGTVGARAVAREMLINPRLQNISLRMLNAVKKNKIPIAQKLYDIFRQELLKSDEEFGELVPEFNP